MATEIDIDTGFYESFSKPIASQSCINLYPQNPQTKGAQTRGALFPTQGIDKFNEVVGICRGMYVFEDILFSVNGNTLYQINADKTFINKGEITGTNRVSISDNGLTMAIVVPSGDSYFYNTNVLSKITDPVFLDHQIKEGGVTSVSSKNGYFIYTTQFEFFWSSLSIVNDGRDFDALDLSTAEEKPDPIVRSIIVRNELYICGTRTIEIFQVVPTATVWQRVNGATIDKGLSARFAIIEFDNDFVYLGAAAGESPSIWRRTQKISTSAIDNAISNYTLEELQDSFAFKYADNGNFFVCFTIADKTFVYDATSSAMQQRPVWHQRSTDNNQWRVKDAADVYGDIYVGDCEGGLIGKLNKETYTEYSETVSRSFTTSYLTNQDNPLFISSVELNTESGVGAFREKISGVNPKISMSFSDDGGNTFSVPESKELGKKGDFTKRQIWNRQGRVIISRVFKFEVVEPVKVVFMNLWLNLKGGSNGK